MLESLIDIPSYVKWGKDNHAKALGLIDKNALYASVLFYNACKEAGIQPIIGLTVEYGGDSSNDHTLTFISRNYETYLLLQQLSTQKMSQSKFDFEDLQPYISRIPVVIDSDSELSKIDSTNQREINSFLSKFPKEAECYLQVSPTNGKEIWQIANDFQLKTMALREVNHFHREGEEAALQIAKMIKRDEKLVGNIELGNGGELLDVDEVENIYEKRGMAASLEELENFVNSCSLEIPMHQSLLPKYPKEVEAAALLSRLAWQGLKERGGSISKETSDRLEFELKTIHEMGFDDYFLIVWDLCRFARESGYFMGFGRGSSAGSLVSYALKITNVNPIENGLFFERFLNPSRKSLPDIDIDMPDTERESLLHYVLEKYGPEHISQIATFNTLGAKGVVRDVGRVFGLTMRETDEWSKAIGSFKDLDTAFEKSRDFRAIVLKSSRNKEIFEISKKLFGKPRNISTHPAGVVMSNRKLEEVIPLQSQGEGLLPLAQFAKDEIEQIGLLKMDFLGNMNLRIVQNAARSIRSVYNETLDLYHPVLDDPKTLEIFQKGETDGIFQFESSGIRQVLRQVSPDSIEDIAAVNALYRPGPQENIPLFVERKLGRIPVETVDERLDYITEPTYGVLVYEEQVMQALMELAGFTLGEADVVRRAIKKKNVATLEKIREDFLERAVQKGMTQENAEQTFQTIEKFAGYGFNRGHAFVYSYLAYLMAYLKVHYSGAFFMSLMNANRNSTVKMRNYLSEAKRYRIRLSPPLINRSGYAKKLETKTTIRFGLSDIKGLPSDFIKAILEARKSGNYEGIEDFIKRLDSKFITEKNMEQLVYSGAFDEFGDNRKSVLQDVERVREGLIASKGNPDLFGTLKSETVSDFSLEYKIEKEIETLGVSISHHPVEKYKSIRLQKRITNLNDLKEGTFSTHLVQVKSVKAITTKKGETMIFLTVWDDTDEVEVTVFPKLFRKTQSLYEKGNILVLSGSVSMSDYSKKLQVLADDVEVASVVESKFSSKTLYLRILDEDVRQVAMEILEKHKGETPVVVVYGENRQKIRLSDRLKIAESEGLKEDLNQLLGKGNARFRG
jgi:DNA polymerase-3 subunit alpha